MSSSLATKTPPVGTSQAGGAVMAVLLAISLSHLLNDLMQSLVPAVYPVLKGRLGLSFAQVVGITLVNQVTASLLQR